MSRPSRARGLKRTPPPRSGRPAAVAPLAGAWIETDRRHIRHYGNGNVAPLAGAWIETAKNVNLAQQIASRPSRARGLKHARPLADAEPTMSRPSRARGLKPICCTGPKRSTGRAPRGRVD